MSTPGLVDAGTHDVFMSNDAPCSSDLAPNTIQPAPSCPDCATPTPLTVAPAGDHGFYLGYICSSCLYAIDILGVLATHELAEALLNLLDPLPLTDSDQRH